MVGSAIRRRRGWRYGEPRDRRLGALPTARGTIARLAYAQVRASGGDPFQLLKKMGLTDAQIDDAASRISVRNQIRFLSLAAEAVQDDLLGFHLAQSAELRELGLLYYVLSSSQSLGEAVRRSAQYSSIVNDGVALKYDRGSRSGAARSWSWPGRSLRPAVVAGSKTLDLR